MNTKALLWVVAAAAGMLLTAPAMAGTLYQVDFKVAYKTGYKSYTSYLGSLCYDDENLNGSGWEKLSLNGNGSTKKGLLGVTFDFKGHTFTEADDTDYPNYPVIKFYNGVFKGLDFLFKHYGNKYHVDKTKFEKNDCYKGYVCYWDPKVKAIPTPAAMTGGLALLASMAFRRRRKA